MDALGCVHTMEHVTNKCQKAEKQEREAKRGFLKDRG